MEAKQRKKGTFSNHVQIVQPPPVGGRSGYEKYPAAVLVPVCFFVSGITGLIYQTLWIRMMDKVIGSAPFAVAAVVTVFMGGLALGSYLAGRLSALDIDASERSLPDRSRLLAVYAKLEVAIGLYALLLPVLIAVITPVYKLAYAHLWSYPLVYALFTFCGCLLLLLPPTTCMGATLPVLCRYHVTHLKRLGTGTGTLYGINSIGAALGAVLCGFVLIPRMGVAATLYSAVAANMAVAGICLLLARKNSGIGVAAAVSGTRHEFKHTTQQKPERTEKPQWWPLAVFAVSGFCAMACEVFWTRLIGLILGPTIYAFSIVAGTFITGLALGSLFFGRLADRLNRNIPLLYATQIGAAYLALTVSQVLGKSQFFFAKVIFANQDNYAQLMVWQSLLLFALLLGPTLCWGAAFPLVSRICTRRLSALGRTIGNVYAVNTIGAVCGTFAAGYVLTPWVGKETGLKLTIALQACMAALGLARWLGNLAWSFKKGVAAALLFAAAFLPFARYPAWPSGHLSRGWYRDFGTIKDDLARTGWWPAFWRGTDLINHRRSGQKVVFQGDGVGGFTTVETENTSLGTTEWAMFNSGKADASSHGDRSTQTLSGHLPLLFHPDARKIMVLGLASGMTAGEVLHYPVEQVDILEINTQVVQACRKFFTPFNNNCSGDARTRFIIQDGRNHLTLTPQHYDVIISEPSNPWMAGLANLYTLEFFLLAKERLTANGIFAQWIQAYEMDWETFSLLGRTFTAAFGGGALIKVGPGDYLLMGFNGEKRLDWRIARDNLPHAQRSAHMVLKGVESLAPLIVTEDLPLFFGKGPLHTDNRPRLEFAAPHRLYSGGVNPDHTNPERRRISNATRLLLERQANPEDRLNLVELGASLYMPLFSQLDPTALAPDQHRRYLDIVRKYCDSTLVPAYSVFADTAAKTVCADLHVQKIRRHLANGGTRPADHLNLGLALAAAGRLAAAEKAFETTLRLAPDQPKAHAALGLLMAQTGRFADALSHLHKVTRLSPNQAEAYKNLGMVEAAAGQLANAANHLSKSLRLAPDDVAALNELGLVQLRRKQFASSLNLLTRALGLSPGNAETHYNLGLVFYYQKKPEQAVTHFKQALRLSPDNANTRHNLQAALAMQAREHEADSLQNLD